MDLGSALLSALGLGSGDILDWAIGIGATVAVGIIVYGGILYTLSAGSESRRVDAIEWIKAAIYGLLILLASYIILNTINPALVGH
ncbi:MAG: hypothetical protein M1361_00680 [Patescibacteria group bacterium]|nr:hypothetical protein [Patescibacteria group bacterium]MCL5224126.1 hypothetical protein [Patescibacteria group bacterium]